MSQLRFRFALIGFTILAFGLIASTSEADGDEKGKGKKDKGKSHVVQVDLAALPPGLAKQLQDYLKGGASSKAAPAKKATPEKKEKKEEKKAAAPVSLIQAITTAEKSGKGSAVKADRKDDHFKVDLESADGKRTHVLLDARGKITSMDAAKKKDGKKK
jgi:hypothetical protein